AKLDRLANHDFAVIRLFLTGNHAEERGLADAVRTDDADNAARRQAEFEIVHQQTIAEALAHPLEVDDILAEPLARRNDDLRIARTALGCLLHQLLIGVDTRLGLGLAGAGACRNPLALT